MDKKMLGASGGEPVRKTPFHRWPVFDEEEKRAVNSVLDSGEWGGGVTNTKVREFESAFAAYHDAEYGLATNSGTAALEAGLAALDIGPDDEVVVPPYTFISTASSVLRVNATPVFADIDVETLNITPESVEAVLSDRTAAVMPVHFAGLPVDLDAFVKIAESYDLAMVEDACHSWGTEWKGRKVGAIGDCGTFSFQITKNMTAAEGGIMITNDFEVYKEAYSVVNCGRTLDRPWYEYNGLGANFRMTEFQGAILLAQMSRLEEQNEKRQQNNDILDREFSRIEGIKTLKRGDERVTRRSHHLYTFRFLSEAFEGLSKERFVDALNAEGIPAHMGYICPIYESPLFAKKNFGPWAHSVIMDYGKVRLPGVEQAVREVVWLPQELLLASEEDMMDVVVAVEKIKENVDELMG